MDLSPFKQDIDELINDFDEHGYTLLSEMKKVWLARKFSYIFEAKSGRSNLALFMQSLYAHCVGHMVSTYPLTHRLGGLYCLYCLYEVQPFKPPFKIYLSLGELRRLKTLVMDAKKARIRVVSTVTRRMCEKNAFLFGFIDMDDYSEGEMLKIRKHKAMLQKMHEKLLADSNIEEYLHADMGKELDQDTLQKTFKDYAEAKALCLKEASKLVDVQDIQHIAEDAPSIGDEVEKIVETWNLHKDAFYKQTRSKNDLAGKSPRTNENHGQMAPLQQQTHELFLNDESLPANGFMDLLTAEDEEDASRELQVEDIERLLGFEDVEEEQSSYADDLEKILADI